MSLSAFPSAGLLGYAGADVEAVATRVAGKVAARYSPPLAHCDLFVTEDCNHRCGYCFVKGKRPRRMTEAVARAAVDWLVGASGKMSWVSILFFGGEPLLEFELIRFLVGYSRERAQAAGKEARFSMTTNGTLMTEAMARYLAEERITYLLSLDGSRETHDAQRKLVGGGSSYEAAMARLPMMKRYQPWQGSRATVWSRTGVWLYAPEVRRRSMRWRKSTALRRCSRAFWILSTSRSSTSTPGMFFSR
jgi:sulfatase maturation enzyme AslB (radical SAM superfamily)